MIRTRSEIQGRLIKQIREWQTRLTPHTTRMRSSPPSPIVSLMHPPWIGPTLCLHNVSRADSLRHLGKRRWKILVRAIWNKSSKTLWQLLTWKNKKRAFAPQVESHLLAPIQTVAGPLQWLRSLQLSKTEWPIKWMSISSHKIKRCKNLKTVKNVNKKWSKQKKLSSSVRKKLMKKKWRPNWWFKRTKYNSMSNALPDISHQNQSWRQRSNSWIQIKSRRKSDLEAAPHQKKRLSKKMQTLTQIYLKIRNSRTWEKFKHTIDLIWMILRIKLLWRTKL